MWGHNDIAYVCRQMVVEACDFESEDDISIQPWDHIIYDFARGYNGARSVSAIQEAFQPFLTAALKG